MRNQYFGLPVMKMWMQNDGDGSDYPLFSLGGLYDLMDLKIRAWNRDGSIRLTWRDRVDLRKPKQ
jgi:hypothetical protein